MVKQERLTGQVRAYLSKLGIQASYKPTDVNAQMPEDPTQINTRRAFVSYTAMVAWFSYCNEALARVRIQLVDYSAELRRVKMYARINLKKKTKWETEDALLRDKKVAKLTLIVERLEAKKIALESVVDNYDRKAAALSRDLTRRMAEFERSSRT